jgi:hypothetical protein
MMAVASLEACTMGGSSIDSHRYEVAFDRLRGAGGLRRDVAKDSGIRYAALDDEHYSREQNRH